MLLRAVFLAMAALLGGVIVWMGTHHTAAALHKLIGGQGVILLLTGEPLTPYGAERVKESRARALRWVDHRRSHVEVAVAHLDQTARLQPGAPAWWTELAAAEGSLAASLELSLAQPVAWLLLARLHSYRGDWPAAAAALTLSLRTGRFIAKDARERSIIGFATWAYLDAETIDRLMSSIAYTVDREPEFIAELAADWVLEEEIAARLVARPDDGARLWRRFARAVFAETGDILLPTQIALPTETSSPALDLPLPGVQP